MVAVPDRLEQAVREPQHHNVLHRLLAEIVIDAENLILFEDAEQRPIERLRRGEIGAEWLLDDDPAPRGAVFARQAGLAEVDADRRKGGRWRRQIKQAISLG